jgi:hypothetical protein
LRCTWLNSSPSTPTTICRKRHSTCKTRQPRQFLFEQAVASTQQNNPQIPARKRPQEPICLLFSPRATYNSDKPLPKSGTLVSLNWAQRTTPVIALGEDTPPKQPTLQRVTSRATNSLLPGSRMSNWVLLATSVLAVVPVWIPSYPPMSDLPQHAAQVALLTDLHNSQFPYSTLFHLNWFTPYLFGYLLIYFMTPIFGIVAACKLVVSLFVAGLPISTGLLIKSRGVDPFWAILCIPCVYGYAYQWGFLNFLVAAPLGILFLWYVLRSSTEFSLRIASLLGIFAVALFFCHALICAFFVICSVLCLWATTQSVKAAILRTLSFTAVVPIALLWMHRTLLHPGARRPDAGDWNWLYTIDPYYLLLSLKLHLSFLVWGRVTGFFPRLLGTIPSWHYVFIGVALFLLPFCAGLRPSKQLASKLPILVCIAVLLWCPHTVFGTDCVYERFTIFAIPLFLLSLRDPATLPKRAVAVKSIALFVVLGLIASSANRAAAFSRQTRGFREALSLMRPGQRALSLVFDYDDGISIAPTFLHFPSWYTAEKQGVVDPSFAMMHPELVVYRTGATPRAVVWDFEWHPQKFTWSDYSGNQYRYFFVRSQTDLSPKLFSKASCNVGLLFHQEEWWVYERADCPIVSVQPITSSSR